MDDKENDTFPFDEPVSPEVSDEALEAFGGLGIDCAYTLGACTGLSVCPE